MGGNLTIVHRGLVLLALLLAFQLVFFWLLAGLEDARPPWRWPLLAGSAAAVLGTAFLALLFYRGVGGRLAVLTQNLQRLARGEALAPPVAGNDEVARL